MYADPIARGGVLEPEGIVEIKFRTPDLVRAMHRLDPIIAGLKAESGPDSEATIKEREQALLPVYRQVGRYLLFLVRNCIVLPSLCLPALVVRGSQMT
jgi:acetyl-CoA carboxylase carboxyltransferase component